MKIIKALSEKIQEELECAECYIKMAIQQKEEFPEVAQTFYTLSLGNMDRIDKLHTQVVSIIKEYRATNGQPPAPMMAIYNYLHQRHIDKTVGIKKLQEMFR